MSPVVTLDEFEVKTGGRLDALDVTEDVREAVRASGLKEGTALVFSPHTTCCVLLAPAGRDTIELLGRALEALVPVDAYYAHDDLAIRTENLVEDEPPNAPAHLAHMMLGRASESIPVRAGDLVLDADQRVLFVELDASRRRRYFVQVLGE